MAPSMYPPARKTPTWPASSPPGRSCRDRSAAPCWRWSAPRRRPKGEARHYRHASGPRGRLNMAGIHQRGIHAARPPRERRPLARGGCRVSSPAPHGRGGAGKRGKKWCNFRPPAPHGRGNASSKLPVTGSFAPARTDAGTPPATPLPPRRRVVSSSGDGSTSSDSGGAESKRMASRMPKLATLPFWMGSSQPKAVQTPSDPLATHGRLPRLPRGPPGRRRRRGRLPIRISHSKITQTGQTSPTHRNGLSRR